MVPQGLECPPHQAMWICLKQQHYLLLSGKRTLNTRYQYIVNKYIVDSLNSIESHEKGVLDFFF